MTAALESYSRTRADNVERRPRFTDQLDLAAVPTAISCAQMFVEVTLINWGAGAVLDDACGVVAELVSDAVESTGVTETDFRWWEIDHLNLIGVRLLGLDASVVIEVWDSDPEFSIPVASNLDTKRWNYFHPRGGGKVVWCELAIPMHFDAPDRTHKMPLPLPRRNPQPRPGPRSPATTERDPELLRRVVEGLRGLDDGSPGGDDMGD